MAFSSSNGGPQPDIFEFGPFKLDPAQGLLTRSGDPIKLPPKSLELLIFFLKNANEVVDKNTLMNEVWRDSFVEDANLTVHISNIRKALNGDGQKEVVIETFPKVGYRLKGDVQVSSKPVLSAIKKVSYQKEVTSDAVAGGVDDPSPRAEDRKPELLPKRPARRFLYAGVGVLILAITLGLFMRPSPQPVGKAVTMDRVRGTEQSVAIAISPNGEYIAHAVSNAGKRALMMTHIGSESSTQLQPADDHLYYGLTFSKNNNSLYFIKDVSGQRSLYTIPILGGAATKIIDDPGEKISFSPNGNQFCFVRKGANKESLLFSARSDGSDEKMIAKREAPESYSAFSMSWSPDGQKIAIAGANSTENPGVQILAVDVQSGQEQVISSTRWAGSDGIEWMPDGSGLVAGLFENGGATTKVWFVPYPTGELEMITNDLSNYGSVGITSDGKTVLAGQFKEHSGLWTQERGSAEARPVTAEKHHLFKWVRWGEGDRLIFASSVGDNRDIWITSAEGGSARQLTNNARGNVTPIMTPDGNHIIFASNRAGKGIFNLYKADADGRNVSQLTFGDGEFQPGISPDGKWVYYTAGNPDGPALQRTIWKLPFDGGEPKQFLTQPSYLADVSPDGRYVVSWLKQDNEKAWQAAITPTEAAVPQKLFSLPVSNGLRWAPDGKGISYVKTSEAVSNVWTQPLDGSQARPETHFTAEQIVNFDWSASGRLVCSRTFTSRDIVLIRNFR
jgi:DNA-binding winged helix-turn-helix (wHTH) protein/Tol biopolymer transport system component